MLTAKFNFDAAYDRASALLASVGLTDEADRTHFLLASTMVRREAAVVRMCNSPFREEAWHKASAAIAACDEVLAKHGLV